MINSRSMCKKGACKLIGSIIREDGRPISISTLQNLAEARVQAIASAKFPVKGLGLSDDGNPTFNGIPLEQCSSAENIRIGVAMAIAASPGMPVMLIRDGSLLDKKSLNLVADMAAEAGAQVWIERVGSGSECTVIIEDGEVKP